MFITNKDINVKQGGKALDLITNLDIKLSRFIDNKRYITKKMVKGCLDYHGLTKDKFRWRFESIFDGEDQIKCEEGNGFTAPEIITPEKFYDLKYNTVSIVKDKVDEYCNDIASRNFSIGIKSIPYQNIRYAFTNLLSKKFNNHIFKTELQKAQFNGAIKGTGFLRVCFNDDKQKFKSLSPNPITTNSGVTIKSVDPEDVFVDPLADNPQELFIVSDYEMSELIHKFPILREKGLIGDIENVLDKGDAGNDVIKKTWRRPKHIGENLVELYELDDLNYTKFSHLLSDFGESGNIKSYRPEEQEYGQPTVFGKNLGGFFYDSYINSWTNNTKESRRHETYEVVEYYNINEGLYIVYIDKVLLYQGTETGKTVDGSISIGIPEPFKELPIVPIYMDNRHTGFYGNPLTENFSAIQEMITESDHAQRLNMLLTGHETIILDSDQLDEEYHANKQLQISKNSPLSVIHTKPQLDDKMRVQPVIVPLQFLNNSSTIHQNRKNDLFNIIERQYPSLKSLIASNAPEAQRETMYSRDVRLNLMIKRQCQSLASLAYKVFVSIIYELDYFSPEPKITIPLYEGSKASSGFMIAKNKKGLESLKEKKKLELDNLYQDLLQQKVEQYKTNNEMFSQLIESVKSEITQQVLKSTLDTDVVKSAFPNGIGNTPEEQSTTLQAIMAMPQVQEQIRASESRELEKVVGTRLLDMARQEVQPIPDTNYYFSIEDLNNQTKLLESIEFSFEKSRTEMERDVSQFINMVSPFQQLGGFMFNLREIAQNIAITSGFDPAVVIPDAIPTVEKMYDSMNTKKMVSQNLSLDKNPLLVSRFANDQLGKEVYTEGDILKSMISLEQALLKLKLEEIATRNATKANSDIIKTQAIEQSKSQLAVNNEPNQQNPLQ